MQATASRDGRRGHGRRRLPALLLGCWAVAGAGPVGAEGPALAARPSRLAAESLLLDVDRAGERLVAVGEWGHVVLSDDSGRSWRQAASVPTRATLTALEFVDAQQGWAVGHDAVILHTTDGGEHWKLQHSAPDDEIPLLSVWFANERRGIAVGAFSLFLETRDGGETWQRRVLRVESAPGQAAAGNPALDEEGAEDEVEGEEDEALDHHLNQIFAGPEDSLFIAAEFGSVFRSRDAGETWERLTVPYEGSLWGGLGLGREVLVFGMRGHVFRSADLGESWQEIESGTDQSLQGASRLSDGSLVLVGLGGVVLTSRDGRSFQREIEPDRHGIADVTESDDGRLLLFGQTGVKGRARTRGASPGG